MEAHPGHNCEKAGKKWMLRSHVVHESTQTAIQFWYRNPSTTEWREKQYCGLA